ncbi:MAG TPA: D-xylose transporter XylE [Candidatus Kryptonia bacterium]
MNDSQENQKDSYSLLITLVATLGGLLFGYDTAVISGTVSALNYYFVLPRGLAETSANSLLGFAVSSALIGCIIGGAIAGFMSNKFGRRTSLLISAILFMITSVGSALPELGYKAIGTGGYSFLTQFTIYRIIGGIGVGMASLLSPMYIAEIAPARKRGKLVSYNQLAIIIGMILVYFVNYFVSFQGNEVWLNESGWRWMFGSEIIPACLFFILLFFIPESPRWLIMNDQNEKALRILIRVNGEEDARRIIDEIKNSFAFKQGRLLSFGLKLVMIGILLAFFQQFVGINVVLYYGPEIFKNLGSGTSAALLQTLIVGSVNFLFTIVAITTVDRFGRKPLQLAGAGVMAISMIGLGFVFQTSSLGIGALVCMLIFMAGFSFSWGPIVWVLLSEIFPNEIRGKAMSISVAVMWISNYLVSWTFPMLDKSTLLTQMFHHGFAYWVYGLMAILAGLFMWRMVPETKGVSLEQMNALWKKSGTN